MIFGASFFDCLQSQLIGLLRTFSLHFLKFEISITQSKGWQWSMQLWILSTFELLREEVHSIPHKPSCYSATFFFLSFFLIPVAREEARTDSRKQTRLTSCCRELGGMEASSKGKRKLVLWLSYNQVRSLLGELELLTTEKRLWEMKT